MKMSLANSIGMSHPDAAHPIGRNRPRSGTFDPNGLLISPVTEDQFHFVQSPEETGVNRIQRIREMEGAFDLSGPSASCPKELVRPGHPHEQLVRRQQNFHWLRP